MSKKKFAAPHYLVSLTFVWSFLFFLLNNPSLYNSFDTFWHIMAGKRILAENSIILNNGWSFSAPNYTWYNISWLWDILLYSIEYYFTSKSIYYFACALYATIISSLTYYLTLDKKLKNSVIIFTSFLVTLILWNFASARPHAVTLLFAIWFIILIKKYSLTQKSFYLYPLPFLMALWVNTHGGFIVGGLILIAKAIEIIQKPIKKWDLSFISFSALTAIAILINPYFYKILLAVVSTTNSSFTKTIDEWQPFVFGSRFFVYMIYLSIFILSFNIKNKCPLWEKFITIIFLFLAFFHIRNIPIFVLLSSGFFATNLQNLNILRDIFVKNISNKKAFIFSSLCLFSIFSLLTLGLWRNVITAEKNPQPAINFITQNYPNHNFFNDYALGGAIIYFSNGKQKVFVDGRAGTAYPEKVLGQYTNFIRLLCVDDLKAMEQYNLKGIITSKNGSIDKIIQKKKRWSMKFSDNNFVVYTKVAS